MDDRTERRHRNPAPPGRDLPPLPLRLPELLDGVAPAPAGAGARAARVRHDLAAARARAPRPADVPAAPAVPDRPGERSLPGPVVLRPAPRRDRPRAQDVPVAQ